MADSATILIPDISGYTEFLTKTELVTLLTEGAPGGKSPHSRAAVYRACALLASTGVLDEHAPAGKVRLKHWTS